MKKYKKIPALLLTTTLCLAALAGCGSKTAPATNESTQMSEDSTTEEKMPATTENKMPATTETKEITLNFWHNYSAESNENKTLTTVLIPKFEEENPGIKINPVPHEWADLHDKILISAKSNTLPDVARLDSAWIPEFQKADILVPMNQEMKDFDQASSGLLESAMSTAKIGNDTYGLALNTNTKILFYNVKMLQDAGVQPPKTMDEFVAACKKLSGKNANGQQVWGYEEPALAGWNLCPFIWSMGGSITSPDQTKATGYLNSKETVAAIQMLADLNKAKAITGWNSGDIPMTDGFGTGRYAMIMDGPWKMAELKGAYPDLKYGTIALPAGAGGSINVLGGEDISIFKSANKDAAWKFVKFMTGEYAQEEMAKCSQIPVNKEALASDTAKNSDFAPFIDALQTAKSRPTVAAWSEIDSQLSAAVSDVMAGKKTAQAAMDELAPKVDQLLSSH